MWRGQKSWNGVAILARGMEPVLTRNALPGDPEDDQSRYIEAAVNGVLIACFYAPNGNPQPGPKFDYKLAWLDRLIAHAAALKAEGVPVVLIGDYNVVPTERDIYPTKSYDKDALVQPQSRAAFARLLKHGWTDAIRALHPDERIYTFWDYMRNRWPRDAGLRLDHILLSPDLAARLKASGVDRAVRGKPNASDHAPVWVELGAAKRCAKKRFGRKSTRTSAPSKRSGLTRQSRVARCWSSTAIPSRIVPTTRFRKTFCGMTENPRAPSSASPTCCCASIRRNARARCSWDGIPWAPRPTGIGSIPHIRADANSTMPSSNNWMCCRSSCRPAASRPQKAPGYEADDFLAAAVAAEEKRKGTVLVASGDRDTFQLASPATTILYPVRAGEMARIGPAEVRERYGVDPHQVPDFIALRGDPSDKLPGAPGVGAQGAAALLRKHGSLEEILAAGKFPALAERLRLFRSIATMNPKAPLPPLPDQTPTWDKAAALATLWELKQLASRLQALAAHP